MKASAPVRNSKDKKPLSPARFSQAVVAALAEVTDPALRGPMRAYMKNQFGYLGIKTPIRRAAVTALIRGQKNATATDLLRTVRLLWAMPEREYQYVAIDLLAHHANRLAPFASACTLRIGPEEILVGHR